MGRQPDMDDDDVEKKKIPDGDAEIRNKKRSIPCRIAFVTVVFSLMIIFCITIPLYYRADTHYSIAIDSVSRLDPMTAGLSFNLTLGVASASYGSKACIHPGTYVVAFYRGIRVAASDALWRQTCAMPRNVVERPFVARATALPVGQVLDSLAAEIRDGAAAFDFVLHVPPRSYGGEGWWATDCKGSRIGGAAVLCDSPNQWL